MTDGGLKSGIQPIFTAERGLLLSVAESTCLHYSFSNCTFLSLQYWDFFPYLVIEVHRLHSLTKEFTAVSIDTSFKPFYY